MRINMGLYKILMDLGVSDGDAKAAAALDDITETELLVTRLRTELVFHRWVLGGLVIYAIERLINRVS